MNSPSTSSCTETTDDTLDQVSDPVGVSKLNVLTEGFFPTSNHSSSDSDAENEGVSSSYRLIYVNLLSAMLSDIYKCPEGLLLF